MSTPTISILDSECYVQFNSSPIKFNGAHDALLLNLLEKHKKFIIVSSETGEIDQRILNIIKGKIETIYFSGDYNMEEFAKLNPEEIVISGKFPAEGLYEKLSKYKRISSWIKIDQQIAECFERLIENDIIVHDHMSKSIFNTNYSRELAEKYPMLLKNFTSLSECEEELRYVSYLTPNMENIHFRISQLQNHLGWKKLKNIRIVFDSPCIEDMEEKKVLLEEMFSNNPEIDFLELINFPSGMISSDKYFTGECLGILPKLNKIEFSYIATKRKLNYEDQVELLMSNYFEFRNLLRFARTKSANK